MKLAEKLINEFTQGITNAMWRYSPQYVCSGCNVAVPKYPGRYPKFCPDCGEPLEKYDESKHGRIARRESKKKKEQMAADRSKIAAIGNSKRKEASSYQPQMRRIPKDRIGGE